MRANSLSVDTGLTNTAVSFFDENCLWRQVFRNTMNCVSLDTWYPVFDEKAYAIIDDRDKYRKGRKSTPKDLDFEYTKEEVFVSGYEAQSFKSRIELNELASVGISNAEKDMTRGLTTKLNGFVDYDFIDLLTDTTEWFNYAISATGFSGAAWTVDTSDPEKDLRTLRKKVILSSNGAFAPNTVITTVDALDALFLHPKVKARFDNLSGDEEAKKKWFFNMVGISTDRVFEVKKVVNRAKKGADKSNAFYMGGFLWMGYLDAKPSREKPTAMAALVPQDYTGNEYGVAVTKMSRLGGDKFEDGKEGIKVFADQYTEVKKISKQLGALLTGVHA